MFHIPVVEYDINYWLLIVPLIMSVFDVITGIVQAIKNKELSSSAMHDGLWGKLGLLLLLIFALAVNIASVVVNLGFEIPALEAVAAYVVLMECISIWENIKKISPEVANSGLFDMLEDLEKKEEEADD